MSCRHCGTPVTLARLTRKLTFLEPNACSGTSLPMFTAVAVVYYVKYTNQTKRQLVVAKLCRVRTRDGYINNLWINSFYVFVAKSKRGKFARYEILDHHVTVLCKREQGGTTFAAANVNTNAALVAVHRQKICTFTCDFRKHEGITIAGGESGLSCLNKQTRGKTTTTGTSNLQRTAVPMTSATNRKQ